MSVAAIGSSALSQLMNIQHNYQKVRGEFQQLGQDLQGSNLAQAQTDFVTLSQTAASQFGSNSPVSKTLNTIGQALQSGNLTAAQQAFSSLPPGLTGSSAGSHHAHAGRMQNSFEQSLNQLGQALQSGNMSGAQQAFAALQQNWQQIMPNSVEGVTAAGQTSSASGGGFSITV